MALPSEKAIPLSRGRRIRTHILAYELLVGPVPLGKVLHHHCENPPCCNPAHLEPKTQQENILLGASSPARNAQKTHCKRGHLLEGDNLRWRKGRYGKERLCRTCQREYMREYSKTYRRLR